MLIIDRFEGKYAIVEYKDNTFNLPRELVPHEAEEGDVLEIKIQINKEETKKRKKEIHKLVDELFE